MASISSLSDPVATARSIASRASRSGRRRIDRESAASYPKMWPTIAERMKPRAGSTCGTEIVAADAYCAVALVGDDDRCCLVGAEDRGLLGDVVGGAPRNPAAHTMISGSDDRSMCFLSSVASQAIDL